MAKRLVEKVLCFPQELLDKLGRFQGFSPDVSNYFKHITSIDNCKYIEREEAETDMHYKQVIPYVAIIYQDMIFHYRRGKHGGENRLHSLYSVGIGGHIAADDYLLFSSDDIGYEDSMWREIREEVGISGGCRECCVGMINDDSNEVGQHHFGIVHLVKISEPTAIKNHSSITDCGFINVCDAQARRHEYETWSQLLLDNFENYLPEADAFWRYSMQE